MKRFLIFLLIPVICLMLAAWSISGEDDSDVFSDLVAQFTEVSAAEYASAGDFGWADSDEDREVFDDEDFETLAMLLGKFNEGKDIGEPLGK